MKDETKERLKFFYKIFGGIYLIAYYINDMFFPNQYLMLTPLGGKGFWGIIPLLIFFLDFNVLQ